jgi:hypothetical protein
MTLIYSFDFGQTTGVAKGYYSNSEAYELDDAWEVPSGIDGFLDWWDSRNIYNRYHKELPIIVAEKFILNPGNQFAADLTGVPIEGALTALWRKEIHWQAPSAKAGIPDALLRSRGLWQTGDDLGHTDGRDANDAIIHSLEFLRRSSHVPTLKKYFPPTKNVEDSNATTR